MVISAKSENHKNEGFESYQSKMKQNNSTQLSGHSFLKTYGKNGTPDPPKPQTVFFSHFPRFPIGNASVLVPKLTSNTALGLNVVKMCLNPDWLLDTQAPDWLRS